MNEQAREYVVGLPVVVKVNDEGRVTYWIDTTEASKGVREDYDAPATDLAAIDADHERRVSTRTGVEILHSRDPDGGCNIDLWIDGQRVREGVTVEDIDPGRGHLRSDWHERIADAEASSNYSPDFQAALVGELEANADSQFIDED